MNTKEQLLLAGFIVAAAVSLALALMFVWEARKRSNGDVTEEVVMSVAGIACSVIGAFGAINLIVQEQP